MVTLGMVTMVMTEDSDDGNGDDGDGGDDDVPMVMVVGAGLITGWQ